MELAIETSSAGIHDNTVVQPSPREVLATLTIIMIAAINKLVQHRPRWVHWSKQANRPDSAAMLLQCIFQHIIAAKLVKQFA
jgi:hypothetical protein